MPPLPDRLRLPATRRFQNTITTIVANATPYIQRAFDNLDTIDEEAVATLERRAAPTLAAVKTISVRSAVGYFTVLANVRPPAVLPREVASTANMRAPFISIWQALASGNNYDAAVAAGRSRIEAVVSDFAVSSARRTGDVFADKAKVRVVGWERIPESGACAWCEEVAGAIYASAESADFGHDRCACSASPIFE